MDQKRLFLAIAMSIAILLGFQLLAPKRPPVPAGTPAQTTAATEATTPGNTPGLPTAPVPGAAVASVAAPVPKDVPRVMIDAPRVRGSISLLGARIDDLVLSDYRETIAADSPLVRLLEPRSDPQPYYVQYGWIAPAGVSATVPDPDTTVWTATPGPLTVQRPVTLSWENGQGLTFQIEIRIDDNYMFDVRQRVVNATGDEVKLLPWSRIRREYLPTTGGSSYIFEGMLGEAGGTLHKVDYATAKKEGDKRDGNAGDFASTGGWAGFGDTYWLTALVPAPSSADTLTYRHGSKSGGEQFQVDYQARDPLAVPANGSATTESRLFAGAKVVKLLSAYSRSDDIPLFEYAVDFGWFFFISKPIFYALDWLRDLVGSFAVAILVFTVIVKSLFFPLANYSYRSMSRMKLLGPKQTQLREQFKDDPKQLQSEIMKLYKVEKVNPVSGCLPMLVQFPVFIALNNVLSVTIEMRQAPFFGWIHDLSQVDPTNVFNLFGLIPFDPTQLLPFLHLAAWPLIMGCTMFFQQRLNPPPPDPTQARIFQFMPIVFTFIMAGFPAGLIIYWSWNNTLSMAQQWFIQRRTRLPKPGLAST